MINALLLALWAGLCTWDQFGPHLGFRKPLLASVGVGIILGNVPLAVMIGATIGIMSGADVASAIALAVAVGIPTATLVQQLNILVMTTNITWLHGADKAAESGVFSSINKFFWLGAVSFFLTRAIPVFIATGIGSYVIEGIMAFLQNDVPWVLTGFKIAGGMMPAVGLAMLLTMMMKEKMWIFLIFGFVLAAFLKIPTVGIALTAVAAAGLWDVITEGKGDSSSVERLQTKDSEVEEYDL